MARKLKLTKEWWIKLLNKHRIVWRDHGHNVKKGNIQIDCPFCGAGHRDKFHMGINPNNGGMYGCWRSSAHRGRTPHKLLMKLLHLNKAKVDELLGDAAVPDLDSWDDLTHDIGNIFNADFDTAKKGVDTLYFPEEFKKITPFGDGQIYFDYLENRGFPRKDIRKVISRYDLKYCDEWNDNQALNFYNRIITPVTIDGELVTWGSRAISKKEKLRYKSLGADHSVLPVKETIYNFDNALEGGRVLLIVEGQVDVWKLDYYGQRCKIRAVGVFNKSIEKAQLYLLDELFDLYDHVAVLLDAGVEHEALLLSGKLSARHQIDSLSFTAAEDPGAATPEQLKTFFKTVLKNYYPDRKFLV